MWKRDEFTFYWQEQKKSTDLDLDSNNMIVWLWLWQNPISLTESKRILSAS